MRTTVLKGLLLLSCFLITCAFGSRSHAHVNASDTRTGTVIFHDGLLQVTEITSFSGFKRGIHLVIYGNVIVFAPDISGLVTTNCRCFAISD